MLLNGFLPDHPAVLVEAGMRCVPLIDMGNTAAGEVEAAAKRLRAIVIKLRLLAQNKQAEKAVAELEAILDEYKKADQKMNRFLLGCFVFLVFACVVMAIMFLLTR